MRGHNNNNINNNSSSASKASKMPAHIRGSQHSSGGNNNNNIEGTITLPRSNKDVTGVQDTIYLCNFRVSVDGEWLCLKELQDNVQNQNEGAPIDEKKSKNIVPNDKCKEKIVERDWINYYCRCFFLYLFFTPLFTLSFVVYHFPYV